MSWSSSRGPDNASVLAPHGDTSFMGMFVLRADDLRWSDLMVGIPLLNKHAASVNVPEGRYKPMIAKGLQNFVLASGARGS